jgi:hypothetical protein
MFSFRVDVPECQWAAMIMQRVVGCVTFEGGASALAANAVGHMFAFIRDQLSPQWSAQVHTIHDQRRMNLTVRW